MKKYIEIITASILLFALLMGTSEVLAQPGADTPGPVDSKATKEALPETESETEREIITDELIERATSVREAIYENLEAPREADEPALPDAAQQDIPGDEQVAASEDSEKPWHHRFYTITQFLQTSPERNPFLVGKGWYSFGRVEGEYANFSSGDLGDDSGFNFRSLRAGIVRKFSERTTVKLEVDLTDGDSNWTDLYGRFKTRIGTLTVGNQKIAQSLVSQTSRLSRTFMELPLPADAFGLGRRLGLGWDLHHNRVGAHLTAFGKDLNDNVGDFGYGARLYFNPAKTRFNMIHIGISAVKENMDQDARFRAYPETRVTSTRLVDTGSHSEVDTQSIYGFELAVAQGSFSLRGEYFLAEWDRNSGSDPNFDGYYLQGNWAVTGEKFQYTQGKFLRIRSNNPRGSWEIAARYSQLNLNDLGIQGGKEKNISLAVNWYGPGNQLRVMSSLIFVDTDAVAGNQDPTIFQIRIQMHW